MNKPPIINQQKGVVLIVCLLLLTVLSLISVANLRSTTLGERLYSNQKSANMAFQAADSALKSGENWLNSANTEPSTCNTSACEIFEAGSVPDLVSASDEWWAQNATNYSENINGVASQPQYIIEESYFLPDDLGPETRATGQGSYYYKVTGKGVGGDNNSQSIIQSVYATRYN